MKLVLPVAGKGTRLRPLTHSLAKPLLPIAGKPMLKRIIDQVLAIENVEVEEIIFITGHLGQQIEEWARDNYDVPMRFIEQKVMNGSADAIRLAAPHVEDDMLVIFADTLFDADMEIMAEDMEAEGIIWTAETSEPTRMGIVAHDDDMWMTELVEKPDEPPSNLANIGMYYVRHAKKAFTMIDMLYERGIRTKGEYNFPEALDLMAKNGSKIRVAPVEGWYDCGTHDTVLETNKLYCAREDVESSVHDTALIERSTLFNCIVLEGARIHDSDLSHSIIGARSIVRNTKGQVIIGSDAVVNGNDNR